MFTRQLDGIIMHAQQIKVEQFLSATPRSLSSLWLSAFVFGQ